MGNKIHAPSGLQIIRNRGTFTFRWKTHNFNKQEFEYSYKVGNKVTKSDKKQSAVKKKSSKKVLKLKETDYYPYTDKRIEYVAFKVRGKPGKKWSKWEDKKTTLKKINNPPTASCSLSGAYSPTFYSSIADHSNEFDMWETCVQYQSCLILNSVYGQGEEVQEDDWFGNTDGTYGEDIQKWVIWDEVNERYRTEFDTAERYWDDNDRMSIINTSPRPVRWFRTRVCGPQGPGDWKYSRLAYGQPQISDGTKAVITPNASGGYDVVVDASYTRSIGVPVDTITIDYSISVPNADLTPSSVDWRPAEIGGGNVIFLQEINAPNAENETKEVHKPISRVPFKIDAVLGDDQLVYVRVNTEYNGKVTTGAPVIATDNSGAIYRRLYVLGKPTNLAMAPMSNNFISVSVYNTCTVPPVIVGEGVLKSMFLAINIIDMSDPDKTSRTIGVIDNPPVGDVTLSPLAIPTKFVGADAAEYTISVQAIVGEHDDPTADSDNVKIYSMLAKHLTSYSTDLLLDLKPPSLPKLTHLMDGNVRVSFDWRWKSALGAEIAWSDYDLAMESNEDPSSYILSGTNRNSVVIKHLEMGITWYFWVRYFDDTQATSWSPMASISLTSAPNVPFLEASRSFVRAADDEVILSWSYVSADNSDQAAVVIAQVIEAGSDITQSFYGDGTKTSFDLANDVDTVKSVKVNGVDTSYTRSGKSIIFATAPEASLPVEIIYTSSDDYYKTVKRLGSAEEYYTDQSFSVVPSDPDLNWEAGNTYTLACMVVSQAGLSSEEWSNTVDIVVPNPITCTIASYTNFLPPVEDDPFPVLTEMPFAVTIEGASDTTMTTYLYIERDEDYFLDRPDGSEHGGFAGETVVAMSHEGDEPFEITLDDVMGYLDDTAYYRIVASVEDQYGQTVTNDPDGDNPFVFRVGWEHQAIMPEAQFAADTVNYAAYIKIKTPEIEGYPGEGDVVDIYRASVDGYELVYPGATFGNTYVDPYPTLGEHGGHLLVYRTANGDFMVGDEFAWLDIEPEYGDLFESNEHMIDFGGDTLNIAFNTDLSSDFSKDFQTTKYLGGSIEGDWTPGVEMTGSITTYVTTANLELVRALHRLAVYEGPCRVRTTNGANFMANVDVSESIPYQPYYDQFGNFTKLASYTLNITRVDSPSKSLIALGEGEVDGVDLVDYLGASVLILDDSDGALVMPDNIAVTLVQPEEGEEE